MGAVCGQFLTVYERDFAVDNTTDGNHHVSGCIEVANGIVNDEIRALSAPNARAMSTRRREAVVALVGQYQI